MRANYTIDIDKLSMLLGTGASISSGIPSDWIWHTMLADLKRGLLGEWLEE